VEPALPPLTLQMQTGRALESPSWERVVKALDRWDTLSRGFFTLIDSAGNYVQTAGASYKAIVEYREVLGDGRFAHYVLGHAEASTEPTKIFSSIGILELNENEIFKLPEVLEIFHCFYEHRTVPDQFVRRDITADFEPAGDGDGGE
jgi:hypothetical protein